MQGKDTLTANNILRYSLTKSFIESFSSIEHQGIELSLLLARDFQNYIQSFIDKNYQNMQYVRKIQKLHKLNSIKNAQSALTRNPKIIKDLSARNGQTILLHEIFTSFSTEQLPDHQVILMKTNNKHLSNTPIPSHFKIFDFNRELSNTSIDYQLSSKILNQINQILYRHPNHKIYNSTFRSIFYHKFVKSIKLIEALQKLILQQDIGIIVDHIEVVDPGTTLSLLARKYNLPFVNTPQMLLSDRSYIPSRASHYAAWGANHKSWLLDRGIPNSQIREVGNVNFYYQMRDFKKTISKHGLFKFFRIPKSHFLAVYTTQPFPFKGYQMEIINWIKQSTKNLPITTLIKPHPTDTFNYSVHINQSSNIFLLPKNIKLYDVLSNSDLIMTISSNTAIEGIMFNLGVIVLQPKLPYHYEFNHNDQNEYFAQNKAGFIANNGEILRRLFQQLTKDHSILQSIKKKGQDFLKSILVSKKNSPILLKSYILDILNKKC